jgi:uncharacterized membrane protein YdbT with pleckstrin-like domain
MDAEPGEQVFFHGHPSWRSILDYYLKGLIVAVVAGAIAGVVTRIADNKVKVAIVAVVVVVIFAIVLIGGLIKRIQTTYTISSRRLTINSGILRREMHETRLERVQNVNSIQSVIERLLRIGTVDFDTAAGAEFDFKFRGVANPAEIVRTVDRAIHEQQQSGVGAEAAGPAPGRDSV